MNIDTKVNLDDVLNKNLSPKQMKDLDNAKKTIANKMKSEGLSMEDIDKLLKPLDLKHPKAQYFLSQLEGIQYDKLMRLTNETGLQLDYTALIPVIMKRTREENLEVKQEDIDKIRQASDKISKNMDIKPNYLTMFLDQLAGELEEYNREKSSLWGKTKRFVRDNLTLILIIILLLVIYLFVRRNRYILVNLI